MPLYGTPKVEHPSAMRSRLLAIFIVSLLSPSCANLTSGNRALENCNSAVATSDEGRWYTANDLPTDWVYNNVPTFRGGGRYVLEVSHVGKVIRCKAVHSSGAKIIDQSICLNLQRRAAFTSMSEFCAARSRSVTYQAVLAWNLKSKNDPLISLTRLTKLQQHK